MEFNFEISIYHNSEKIAEGSEEKPWEQWMPRKGDENMYPGRQGRVVFDFLRQSYCAAQASLELAVIPLP